MSVVFDFNASHNDAAPVSPILLPAYVKRKEKSELLMDNFACLLLSLPLRLSIVSVVFDFNDSLNDVTPMSLMLLSVDEEKKGKSELLVDVFCVSFFCFHFSD